MSWGSPGPEHRAGVFGKNSACLLLLLVLLSPAAAFSSVDRETDYALLLSRPLGVLVVNGGRMLVDGELTIRDGRAYFRMRNGMLYSLPLEEIDVQRTARANGISEAGQKRLAEREPALLAPEERNEEGAMVATMQTVTTVGLAAREGERRTSRDGAAAVPGDRWTFFTGVTSVGETNIRNEAEGTPDVGVIPSFGLNYRNNGKRATFEGSYTAAFHSYSRSEEWNRTSHNLSASFEPRWRGRWRSQTVGGISIKGANEDRDLSDRYSLSQRLRFRVSERASVRLTAAYRLKLFEDDPTADERNPHGGIDFRFRFASRAQWSLGYRLESNLAEAERRVYRRATMATDLMFPLGQGAFAKIGVLRRDQHYPSRLVLVDGERVPRQDEQWLGSFSISRRFFDNLAFALEYQYERRLSNDPGREFDGHSLGLSLIRFW